MSDTTTNEEEELVRIRIGPVESGWGVHVKDDLYRVRNVPVMTNGINADGLIRWSGNFDDDPVVLEVGMLFKQAVHYETEKEFRELDDLLRENFIRMEDYLSEGWVGPTDDGKPGIMVISYGRKGENKTGHKTKGFFVFLLLCCDASEDEDGELKLTYRGRGQAQAS